MAIPSSGKVSIGDIRTELQNGGTSNFSLKLAGRPTTGVPGTFQNPIYTPINQSSSSKPNNAAPYSVSEWRQYNHSENLPCVGENIIITFDQLSFDNLLYRYDFITNERTSLPTMGLSESDDIAITENKLFLYRFGNEIVEYNITLNPWSIGYSYIYSTTTEAKGLFAKNDTTLIYWYKSGSVTYIMEATITPGNPALSTQTIFSTTRDVTGELFYDAVIDKYYLLFIESGSYNIARYSSTGSFEQSLGLPGGGSIVFDGIFSYAGTLYVAAANRDIYLVNFSSASVLYSKTMPSVGTGVSFKGITQATFNSAFTSPTLGTFYTYYRVLLRGGYSWESQIQVVGNGTTNHWCGIYTSYPFNSVGQVTASPWTYSLFLGSTTKTFVRTMLGTSETLHIVLYQDAQ